VGTLYQYAVPTDRTHVPYPRTVPTYRTRTQKHVPTYRTHTQKHVPTYRTVPNPPLGMYTVPPRDAQIENLDFITLKN